MIDRYACRQVAQHWDEVSKLSRWSLIWLAASNAIGHPVRGELGVLDVARVHAREARYGHDVAAACEALREVVVASGDTEGARWLHYGLCSSDVVDSGLWLTCRDVTAELIDLAEVARSGLGELGSDATQVLHRTHGQPARVQSAGSRWHRHAINLGSSIHGLRAAQRRLSLPSFTGPTGEAGELTLIQRRKLRAAIAGSEQGSGNVAAGQAVGRDDYINWLQAVSRLATVCERFGRDVRLLAMTGEVREGRGPEYRGSSSMPHKHNPTRSERLCGLAPVVRGLVAGYQEAAAECWDAHSLEHSSAERVCFPAVTELVGFMLTEFYEIASTLECEFHNAPLPLRDSYAERNELIRRGADGGEAWEAVRDASASARGD